MTTTKTRPWQERFWTKVDKTSDPNGCWLWTAASTNNGYGVFRNPRTITNYVHRVAYELLVGPIPEGLELDHLCRVRNCCNPDHLEPVTRQENLRRSENFAGLRSRQTHCVHGHEFTEANIYRRPGRATRECRTCRRIENRKQYSNRHAQKAVAA